MRSHGHESEFTWDTRFQEEMKLLMSLSMQVESGEEAQSLRGHVSVCECLSISLSLSPSLCLSRTHMHSYTNTFREDVESFDCDFGGGGIKEGI